MSTYKSSKDVNKEIDNWIRLSILLHSGIKEALLSVLHNNQSDPLFVGLPKDPVALYLELSTTHLTALNNLKKKKLLNNDQWEILLPQSKATDSNSFDVTLIVLLITNVTSLPCPLNGWDHKKLSAADNSKSANVIRARQWRNFLNHTNPSDIDHNVFSKKLQEGEQIIKSLGHVYDINPLKTMSLDPQTSKMQKLILQSIDELKNIGDERYKDVQLINQKVDGIDVRLQKLESDCQLEGLYSFFI